ncbi:tRNA glutamyl-Q(34) synthetase GluQRS [Amylibacter sp. IMCC11727]|uniref:tRNA glutamyl-Q(34) synthetase GluQRS n=1 Tax=Amylibacter sp. IMCC11727 TaxID=3039851 RepID=UPI00244DE557|nr:tRNA glutamyl-Q(34) synthetase GluQRS [Amylibacter sp. IMCC11727]WGI20434.1 tRNA glutamyl-Q(34) synthetase GluQRS [Amylibacter sp. IMCC11727]
MTIERFAPSPTGLLHLGHAFSALTAFEAAQEAKGRFLLRIEDIDGPRCKPEYVDAIYDDLRWLGIRWDTPVLHQLDRLERYQEAVDQLTQMGLTYPCSCTRKDIAVALSAPQEGDDAAMGPDGVIYPGTCRHRISGGENDAIRLDMRKAVKFLGTSDVKYREIGEDAGPKSFDTAFLVKHCGDIVLARKDIGTSYHIAVVVDDAFQEVTHVTRGLDMAPATPIHVLLQRLFGYATPTYRHHRLIRDDTGKRLAKRHDALAISALRQAGWSVADVKAAVGSSA